MYVCITRHFLACYVTYFTGDNVAHPSYGGEGRCQIKTFSVARNSRHRQSREPQNSEIE